MATTVIRRNAQRAEDHSQKHLSKSTVNGSVRCDVIAARRSQVNNYLKTREGLWRLLALFPPTTPVVEAIRTAPALLCRAEKGGRV